MEEGSTGLWDRVTRATSCLAIAILVSCGGPAPRPGVRTIRRDLDDCCGGAATGALREGATRPMLRIPLVLNARRSWLSRQELGGAVDEVNRIWAQAGICFEVRSIDRGFWARARHALSFIGGDVAFMAGRYDNDLHIWAEDAPRLRRAPHPAAITGARTAAHELGHALGLNHLPRVAPYLDALMSTGYDGYELHPFEIRAAREKAAELALPTFVPSCRPLLW